MIRRSLISRRLPLLAVMLAAAAPCAASGDEEKEPACSLRFLAVGNAPPFRQEIRGGIRYELPPPPGSIPPRRLVIERRGTDEPGEEPGEELGEIALTLGRVSAAVGIPAAGERPLRLREKDGESAWLEMAHPGEGEFLVILRRDPDRGSWEGARARVVPDRLPAGALRFINASDNPLALLLGEKKIALEAAKIWTTRLPAGEAVGFQLGVPDGAGGLRRVLSRGLEQGRDERTLVVLSEADRPDARSPVRVTVLRESVRNRLPSEPAVD